MTRFPQFSDYLFWKHAKALLQEAVEFNADGHTQHEIKQLTSLHGNGSGIINARRICHCSSQV
jgi:hypothetical protein